VEAKSVLSPALTLVYPVAPRDGTIDTYGNVAVPDPFRPLEDLDAPATVAWVQAENAVTEAFLETIPEREAIRERLSALWDYERRGLPSREGTRYVYFKNDGLQNQAVMYVADRPDGTAARVLLDPNTLSPDGTVALSATVLSEDGSLLAYALTVSGSDWQTWYVRDVATGADLSDEVRWGKFSGASWLHDGSGFFYSRYDEPDAAAEFKGANYFHKVYLHRIGTPQSADELIYERPDQKEWNFSPEVSADGRWLLIGARHGSNPKNRLFVRDLADPAAPFALLTGDGDAGYGYIGNDGDRFYLQTTLDAPRGRVVGRRLGAADFEPLIGERTETLESASLFGDTFILQYLRDAHAVVLRFALDGTARGEIALPGLGTVGGFDGRRAQREAFFAFTSYTRPTTIYRYDVDREETSVVFAPVVAFDPDDFESEQVFYASKDGTRIPLIVSRKKGTPRDAAQPTILYGYGGFDVSLTPAFSPGTMGWMDMGGAFAVANLRGGGEYGEEWHLAGTRAAKQNVFDDFIAGAEFLIAQGYTSREKLAIMGGSNGGLLVGATMTQRPDLCAAALPAVGVMDMLRFQRFTIGWAWTNDYGSSDEPELFPILYGYSPLHALRDGVAYPATLITTADHDDRVFPAHSFKFAARLQEAHAGTAPVLIRVESKAGHGAGKPTAKLINEAADRYAFLVRVLGFSPSSIV
jgi:prolyl oligopeptidase